MKVSSSFPPHILSFAQLSVLVRMFIRFCLYRSSTSRIPQLVARRSLRSMTTRSCMIFHLNHIAFIFLHTRFGISSCFVYVLLIESTMLNIYFSDTNLELLQLLFYRVESVYTCCKYWNLMFLRFFILTSASFEFDIHMT